MTVPITLTGRNIATSDLTEAHVLVNGALHTDSLPDTVLTGLLETDDVPVAIVPPLAGTDIIFSGVIFSTDRNVGPDGATIDFYYAESATSTDTTNIIIRVVDMAKNTVTPIVPLRIRVPKGNYALAKTNDDNATVITICHYEMAT